MSSNIRMKKMCLNCKTEFIAKTTVTKFCSHNCARIANKKKNKEIKIQNAALETHKVIDKSIEALSVKEFLSVKEVALLLGCSKHTIYKLIKDGKIKAVNLMTRKTIIKKTDLDELFTGEYKPLPNDNINSTKDIKEEAYYSVEDVERIYSIKYQRLYKIVKENSIDKKLLDGKLYVSKIQIDKYFKKKRKNYSNIKQWYTVGDIQQRFGLKKEIIYDRASYYSIPRKRIGNCVYISKEHFDKQVIQKKLK